MRDVLELLGPIFLLVLLGVALQRGGFFRAGVVPGLNRLCYWVALPALILGSLARGGPGAGTGWAAWSGGLLGVLAATTVAVAALGWGGAAALGIKWETRGTFAQAFFRGNLAFVGLPILLKVPGLDATKVLLLLAPMMVLYNVIAVALLVASRHGVGWSALRSLVGEWLRNPILWASGVGGAAFSLGWVLPAPLGETVSLLGKMAVPLALVTIGAVLAGLPTGRWQGAAWLAIAGKVGVSPLLGWAATTALAITGQDQLVLLVALACPTAVVSYTMAEELGGDAAMAAQAVVGSTAASAGVLALILAWAG
ncbi:MAG: AEC family transporter [Opitutaceae bacterium]|nr:AEC family transporter [Opitutaceae bacterium]